MVSKYSGSTGRKLGYDKRCNRGISWEDPIWPEMFRFRWGWGIGSFEWKRQQVTFTLSVMTSGQYIGQWEWHSDQYEDWNWLKYYTFSHTFDVWHAKRWSLLWFWSELCHFHTCMFFHPWIFLCRLSSLLCPDDSDDKDLDLGSGKITLFFVITTLA